MNHPSIKVSSNWTHVGGCSFSQCVKEVAADPSILIKPDINELVDEERSILLSRGQYLDRCELNIHKLCYYNIQAVSFVCNVLKVEFYHGPIMEYIETVYGTVVDETDNEFKSYRYDVENVSSGVTELTLRFMTNSSEVCIFGFILHTSPDPNGITSLSHLARGLDAKNVLQTGTMVNKDSEKLVKHDTNMQNSSLALEHCFQKQFKIANDDEPCTTKTNINGDILDNLKFHIDKRFEEIAMLVNSKFTEMEEQQNKKLDKILHILTNK